MFHAGQSGNATAAQQAKQDRFCLIIRMMRRGDHIRPALAGMSKKQIIARLTCTLLQATGRLFALPRQDGMWERKSCAPLRDLFSFITRFRAQGMIDCGSDNVRPASLAPITRKMQQRHRIRPARNGHEKARYLTQRCE